MKATKQYPIVCPSCRGEGVISNPSIGLTTNITIICPACNGNKIVICTETIEDHLTMDDLKADDKAREERDSLEKNSYSFETGI